MAVPKRKTSKSRRDMRSAHKALDKKNITISSNGSVTCSHINPSLDRRTAPKRITKKEREAAAESAN